MPNGYLSEIETGKKPGSVAAYKSLARALGTGIDLLIPELSVLLRDATKRLRNDW